MLVFEFGALHCTFGKLQAINIIRNGENWKYSLKDREFSDATEIYTIHTSAFSVMAEWLVRSNA